MNIDKLKARYVRLVASIPLQLLEDEDSKMLVELMSDTSVDFDDALKDSPEIHVVSQNGNLFKANIKLNGPKHNL